MQNDAIWILMNVNYNKRPMLSILLRERERKHMKGMFKRYANIYVTDD